MSDFEPFVVLIETPTKVLTAVTLWTIHSREEYDKFLNEHEYVKDRSLMGVIFKQYRKKENEGN